MTTDSSLIVLGITGPIACGKSTVSKMTVALGAIEHIDADVVTHQLMAPGTEVTARIVAEFGAQMKAADGSVDRRVLGQTVFTDEAALRRLEAIVHPAVRQAIGRRIDELRAMGKGGVVTVEAIRLLQSPVADSCDAIWVVACAKETQLARLRGDRGLPDADSRARLAAQPLFEDSRVTKVIINDAGFRALDAEVDVAWAELAPALSRLD